MRRFMPLLAGQIVAGLSGFSITAVLLLTRHALAVASPLI